jgi:hypothetical protein
VFELVQGKAELNLRALAAAYLVAYGGTTGPFRIAQRARPLLARLMEEPGVTALSRGWGGFINAFYWLLACDERACLAAWTACIDGRRRACRRMRLAGSHCAQQIGIATSPRVSIGCVGSSEVAGPGHSADRATAARCARNWPCYAGTRVPHGACPGGRRMFEEAGTHFHRCYSRLAEAWSLMDRPAEAERAALQGRPGCGNQDQLAETEAHYSCLCPNSGRGGAETAPFEVARLKRRAGHSGSATLASRPVLSPKAGSRWTTSKISSSALSAAAVASRGSLAVAGEGVHAGQFRVLVDDQPLAFSHKVPRGRSRCSRR